MKEDNLIKADIIDIGDINIALDKDPIIFNDLNYFMTCPISRASETMAKCIIAKKESSN